EEGHHGSGNGAHAAGKGGRVCPAVPQPDALFQDFYVGIVDPAVDEAHFPFLRGCVAVRHGKEILAFFGRMEYECGGEEYRRFYGAFTELGFVAMPHHRGFGRFYHWVVFLQSWQLADGKTRCSGPGSIKSLNSGAANGEIVFL